jgi:hypothetical protein
MTFGCVLVLTLSATLLPQQSQAQFAEVPPAAKSSPKYMPPLQDMLTLKEQEIMTELAKQGKFNRPADLALFDEMLGRLKEPTKFRGSIQMYRALRLIFEKNDPQVATEAVEESIKLLPGYSAPLIAASVVYAYNDQPVIAADYVIRAAELDPETIRAMNGLEVDHIMRRLRFAREDAVVDKLSERLLDIGWHGLKFGDQSRLALDVMERRIRAGDVRGARALAPKIVVPSLSYDLLTRKEFEPLWADIEQSAGPRLEKQWSAYLTGTRQRWVASKSSDAVQEYVSALSAADQYDAVILDFYPLLMGELDSVKDAGLVYVAPQVASALARKGRWDDVDKLFDHVQAIWPLGSGPFALNISSNWAQNLLVAGKADHALMKMDGTIAEATRLQVNPDALSLMHQVRACILHQMGRDKEAIEARVSGLGGALPADAARAYLCTGDVAGARQALLDGLSDEERRSNVIGFVQPMSPLRIPGEYSAKQDAMLDQLHSDPEIIAEVQKYGRILPFRMNEAAPR